MISNGCIIEGNVTHSSLATGVTVEAGSRIKDSVLLPNVKIGKNCKIGPFAHLRGDVVLEDYVKMVHELITDLKLKNIYLIGHSSGGKISIIPFDEIYNLIMEGDKYLRVKTYGFVEVPGPDIFSILKSFIQCYEFICKNRFWSHTANFYSVNILKIISVCFPNSFV